MQNGLTEWLQKENPRLPYTDDQLAALLGIRRERVIELRRQAGVPDSRERLKPVLRQDCIAILRENPVLSDRALTIRLNELGYSVSRYLVGIIRQELPPPVSTKKEEKPTAPQSQPDVEEDFSGIIGWDGGLKTQINQAKAAVAYPPNGLHTLITGPSGTGKTYLAENMYQYAVHHSYLPPNAPFVIFNCADYADNPQLLISQLFGYVKGAFSGANETRDGLVEKADGGILFLDEVHRLPSEGQEQLFFLLDKGSYRRLGDSGLPRQVGVRLIAATTSTPESSLLLTFRRRIPMVISMPSLESRSIQERYAILRSFFSQEAAKLKRTLIVDPQAINILLQYSCPGNVGQMHSDIQVCCANAFLESISANQEEIRIGPELVEYLLCTDSQLRSYYKSGRTQFWQDLILSGDELGKECIQMPEESIYQIIQDTLSELQESGMNDAESFRAVRVKLDQQIRHFYPNQPDDGIQPPDDESRLNSLVEPLLWEAVQQAVEPLKAEFPQMDENLQSVLAIHLDSVVRSLAAGTYSRRADTANLQQSYPREYAAACSLLTSVSEHIGLKLPTEEAVVLAMYLHAFSSRPLANRIRVIVLTHGEVGPAMANVANKMLRDDNAIGIAMALDESSDRALECAVRMVREIDEEKGCLLLVDMGSLASLAPEIEFRTGIQVRCVARVDTLMVLDAVRRAGLSEEYSLDELADALEAGRLNAGFSRNDRRTGKPPAILTVCATGEGNARRVRSFMEATIPECNGIHIVELGLLNRDVMLERVDQIKKEYDVVVVVGTMNPELPGVPFLSMNYVFSSHGTMALTNLLTDCCQSRLDLATLLQPELILCDVEFGDKNEAIDQMTELLLQAGCVTPEFQLSVYKRENMGATCLPEGIAIPHGDTAFVTKPAICVAKTRHPLEWVEDFVTNWVFLFALNESCAESVQIFFQIIKDEKRLYILENATTPEEILKILTQ
ncbi:MAG TPA: transcriptional regulator [Firmicutes bacterium]|jgi:transcriptional regulator with AAA-type ATPase domain/transcriptional regulatory protein LevR|nr:transcriptional regulator [Bacillota bacterium]